MSDLQVLSDAWQRFGCAMCGTTVATRAESGFYIELHHIIPRSQGGEDTHDNLMGLCGELLPNKCHWRVTTNRVKISWEPILGAWIWTDTRTGEEDICRVLKEDVMQALDLGRELPPETVVPMNSAARIPAEYLPSPLHAAQGMAAAQERFTTATELVVRAERTWMALALVVQAALSLKDDALLGFGNAAEWAEAVGISRPTLSKLRLVAMQFQGSWLDLPKQDRDNLSFEGLYVAAKLVKLGVWDKEQAMAEAVAKPVTQLWLDLRGLTLPVEQCTCPTCGVKHWATQREHHAKREHLESLKL